MDVAVIKQLLKGEEHIWHRGFSSIYGCCYNHTHINNHTQVDGWKWRVPGKLMRQNHRWETFHTSFKKHETLKWQLCRRNMGAIFCNHVRWRPCNSGIWLQLLSQKLTSAFALQSCSVTIRPVGSHEAKRVIEIKTSVPKKDSWASHASFPRSWEPVLFWWKKKCPVCHWHVSTYSAHKDLQK